LVAPEPPTKTARFSPGDTEMFAFTLPPRPPYPPPPCPPDASTCTEVTFAGTRQNCSAPVKFNVTVPAGLPVTEGATNGTVNRAKPLER